MIPHNQWASDTTLKPYATYELTKPSYVSAKPFELELGPAELGDGDSGLIAAWWLFEYDHDDSWVYASKYDKTTGSFGPAQQVFQDPDGIERLSATFDQLGRPLVFYSSGTELRLYWFDPVLASNVKTYVADGSHPFSTFDIRWDTSNSSSDAMLFYTRNNAIYYRMQRDRYETEYSTPVDGVTRTADKVLEADMAVDYRLQVLYRYIDENYSPPAPVPPTSQPVPVDVFWAYKLNGYQSRIATGRNLVLDPLDQFTVSFDLESVQLNKPVIGLFSQNLNPDPGLYGAALSVAITGGSHDVLRTVIGGVMGEVKLPFSLQPGHWVFDFMLDGGKRALSVKLKQAGELEYIEAPLFYYPVGSNKESAAGFIFGAVSKSAGVVNALAGMLRNCRLKTSYWPFDITIKVGDKADGDYPKTYNADDSVNAGFVARILDYNSHSWQFVK